MRASTCPSPQRGASMIEVLVTIVIMATGLLGVAGLQSRLQVSEMEGYQRAQAMILLEDMSHRFAVNRTQAPDYVTGLTAYGTAMTCPDATVTARDRDVREWCLALQGAGEKIGENKIGVMIGGRGCVESLGNSEYMITVAWQGLGPVSAPPASVACGKDQYNDVAETGCVNDRCRRAVTTIVKIAPLK